MPKFHWDKAKEASLFLTTAHTGQRVATMHEMRLKDIKQVIRLKNGNLKIMVFIYFIYIIYMINLLLL